jgi:hypothetical protein
MGTETISPATTPAKMSRYRSVRRAQEQQKSEHVQQQSPPPLPPMPPSMPELEAQNDAPIIRSMSRYHRRPPTSHATTPKGPPLRSNTLQAPQTSQNAPSPPIVARSRAASSPYQPSQSANTAQYRPKTARQRPEALAPGVDRQHSQDAEESARKVLQKERERQRQMKDRYEAEARAESEAKQAEIDRLETMRQDEEEAARQQAQREAEEAEASRRQKEEQKAEQERGKRLRKAETQKVIRHKEEEAQRAKHEEKERRARVEEESAHKAAASPPVSPPRHGANFGLFKRRRDDGLTQEASAEASKPLQPSLGLDDHEGDVIRPGGGGIVLGIDAPTSAVNAGDRVRSLILSPVRCIDNSQRVTVMCAGKRMVLPVTPTTTPLDLIKTASTVLTVPIDVRTAVMQELFAKVSIVRPLRNYEYVRDIMNSWDADNQNDLTIIDSQIDGIDQDDLLAYKVSEMRPSGMSCYIHYSSRPGKWSKRYMTLRPDGQLIMAKNEKAKEKDQENILTLTDYDIYSVTQTKLAKVKPPKKICYAVKSLQKSNIFADESQYVHFFCINDRATAIMFYKALQGWRSWYLKHQKGEGLKKKPPTQRKISEGDATHGASAHTRGESVGSHYQLGAFSSLMDLDDFNKKLDTIEPHRPGEFPEDKPLAGLGSRAMHSRNRSLRVKHPPPSAFNRSAPALDTSSQNIARQGSVRKSSDQQEEAFSSGGLLGRSYTQRQATVQERDKQPGPFTEGPSLISGMDSRMAAMTVDSGLNRKSSTRSNHHNRIPSDLQRSTSKRVPGMPEPLVDLRPSYRPPPQHLNKGKGYNPGTASGPLVESATSIEEAIRVPPSTDWRARPSTAKGHGNHGGGLNRTRSLKGRGEPLAAHTFNNHSGAPETDQDAFTGGGLLSTAGYSQGFAPIGRGVMDGSKAKGPMIDLSNSNQIAPGSLLYALPDTHSPVIDRSGR